MPRRRARGRCARMPSRKARRCMSGVELRDSPRRVVGDDARRVRMTSTHYGYGLRVRTTTTRGRAAERRRRAPSPRPEGRNANARAPPKAATAPTRSRPKPGRAPCWDLNFRRRWKSTILRTCRAAARTRGRAEAQRRRRTRQPDEREERASPRAPKGARALPVPTEARTRPMRGFELPPQAEVHNPADVPRSGADARTSRSAAQAKDASTRREGGTHTRGRPQMGGDRACAVPTEVGVTGFEPAASCSRSKRSAKLSYTPPRPFRRAAQDTAASEVGQGSDNQAGHPRSRRLAPATSAIADHGTRRVRTRGFGKNAPISRLAQPRSRSTAIRRTTVPAAAAGFGPSVRLPHPASGAGGRDPPRGIPRNDT